MKRTSSQAGFTMVEVMISVLVTAIAALGFIAMYMTQTQAGAFTRHSTEASVLANDKLEALRGIGSATSLTSGTDAVDAQGNSGSFFTRRWTVTPVGTYTDLAVYVGWNEDETVTTCTTDANCTRSGFCNAGNCLGRAVIVRGRRDTP